MKKRIIFLNMTLLLVAYIKVPADEPIKDAPIALKELELAKLIVTGPIEAERGSTCLINATLTPSTLTPNKVEWIFTGGKEGSKVTTPNLFTTVILVDGVSAYTVTCKVTIDSGEYAGEYTDTKNIFVKARGGWSITPKCYPDFDPKWGDFPGAASLLGECTDRATHTLRAVVPADGGFSCAQVKDPNGPNDGYFYVQSAAFKIEQGTLINKFLKPGMTPYNPPNIGFYEYNTQKGVDVNSLRTGTLGHENAGTDSNKGNGHFAYMEAQEAEPGMDALTAVEDNWHPNSEGMLKSETEKEKDDIDKAILDASIEPTGNWGPSTFYYYDFTANKWKNISKSF